MKSRYGEIPEEDFREYKKRIHSMVHWLLVYADEDNPCLQEYFIKVQTKLAGLSSLLPDNSVIVELMVVVESAKLLMEDKDFNRKLYRKLIFDGHDLVERLFG